MVLHGNGDRNIRFFHSLLKGRRKKLQLSRIKNGAGDWIEDTRLIAEEAMRCFKDQFSQEAEGTNYDLLNYLSEIVIEVDNENLNVTPTMEEVTNAVFSLNGSSICGPDGLSGIFYQYCWKIVAALDILDMVKDFFKGNTLPKSITHQI